MRRNTFWLILLVIIAVIDLGWIRQWGWPAYAVNFSLLFIIILTYLEDLATGLVLTALVSLFFSVFSPLWSLAYWLAFFSAALISLYVSRNVFSSRSTISLLATTSAATAAFYLVMILYRYSAVWLAHSSFSLPISPLLIAAAIQIIFHPLILWGIWGLAGANKYAQINTPWQRVF